PQRAERAPRLAALRVVGVVDQELTRGAGAAQPRCAVVGAGYALRGPGHAAGAAVERRDALVLRRARLDHEVGAVQERRAGAAARQLGAELRLQIDVPDRLAARKLERAQLA